MNSYFFKAISKAHFAMTRLWDYARENQLVDEYHWHVKEYQRYLQNPLPWSAGYLTAKRNCILTALADRDLQAAFQNPQQELPRGYGYGIDERAVELPWALNRLHKHKGRMLDAGSALNHSFLLEHPVFKDITLDIFTFAPEKSCEWQKGISYLYGDLRDLPYKDALFDTVVSISTLEHVGMDNSFYKKRTKEHATDDVFRAFSECKRVLKQSGCLLFSVPFGTYEDHTAFQQFDAALLKRCEDFFQPSRQEKSFFLYSAQGWQRAAEADCAAAEYALAPGRDNAAAARAVACCAWWK